MLSWQELRETYGRELVNLRNERRYNFLNTLFSVSEAVMYMQARPASRDTCANGTLKLRLGRSTACTAAGFGVNS